MQQQKNKLAKIGQNFVYLRSWALFGSPVCVALFDVTISNCCSKGIIGGIISFKDISIESWTTTKTTLLWTLALGAHKNVKQLINAEDGKGDLICRGDQSKGLTFMLKWLVLVRQF